MLKKSATIAFSSLALLTGGTMLAKAKTPFRGATATQPASRWEECMLTGNGRMGAMVFGRPYDETAVINHCKLYLPRGSREIVHDLATAMPELKKAGIAAGKDGPAAVHRLMLEKTGQKIIHTDPFHPGFMLRVVVPGTERQPTDYVRTEDFETGELGVRWRDRYGSWKRKLFASRPDKVVVMSMAGPRGQVGCELSLDIRHELVKPEIVVEDGWILAHTVYVKGKGGYDSLVRVVADGGKTASGDGKITVSDADHILLLVAMRTWRTPLPKEQSEAWAYSPDHPDYGPEHTINRLPEMKKHLVSLSTDYDTLLRRHAKGHGDLFSRVSLDLGGGDERRVTSEDLLRRAATDDRMPLALMERMYDACRYLTICSTGERPANLQGIWTGTWKPAWSGDYTLDSNLQLEVQSLMTANLPELMESYLSLVESWLPECRLNAKKLYGCRGIVSNARASNTCLLLHWGRWPGEQAIGCMGWMAHFFYDTYLFTGDRYFLAERVVPLLKESVLFYEDLLAGTEDENGKYRFFIGYSPEHGLNANTTFDISIAKAMLTYLIDACEELDIEKANVPKWKTMLVKMPPYLVNEKGELKEWSWPGVGEDYNQRHHSHFLPLYQFCEFDPETTPDMWKAAGLAFEGKVRGWLHRKKGSNSNHITHGMANQGQCAARLGRGEIVWEVLSRMATKRYLYPSFMISYWPGLRGFGFDPVGTIPDVVNNSLIFSWGGTVDILPALPKEWPKGSISGILARGQIKVERLAWDRPAGSLELQVVSGKAQTVELRLPEGWQIKDARVTRGGARIEPGKKANSCSCMLKLPEDESVELAIRFAG